MATIYRKWFPCTVTFENPHGKGYTGYTYQTLEERDRLRFAPSNVTDSVGLKRAITKYGIENMQTDTIEEILPIHDLVTEREIYWIAHFDDFHNGCNLNIGGNGLDSETARKISRKRVADGTHHFLGGEITREINRKRVADGTHNFLDSEFQSEINRKRVADGTHHFLGGEIQSETSRKRVADGTHNFLGGEINHKRVVDGTHPFLRENHPKARPEYEQAKWEFILLYPLGIKEARKQLFEKFSDVPQITIYKWVGKWQAEFQTA